MRWFGFTTRWLGVLVSTTALHEWAYAHTCGTSSQHAQHLRRWLDRYNWHRPNAGLNAKPPISQIGLTGDNLLQYHNPL